MNVPLFHVDAFADRPFTGNPAAVCLLPGERDGRWMQQVAAEMNLSETAFLHREGDAFRLRWFTPAVEVDLCGHATLASAHVLWQEGLAPPGGAIRFHTRSGVLAAVRRGEGIELDFPQEPAAAAAAPPELAAGLGVPLVWAGRNRFDVLVEVDSEATLRALAPDFRLLATVPVRGIIVTSRSADPQFDFASRTFFPAIGVNEDPVCGSAHCCLGPYWARRLGKDVLAGWQASARGGVVRVRLADGRAFLAGRAVVVARGALLEG
jgi:predicted PhzF superfamily epimerase YddE/YHI9